MLFHLILIAFTSVTCARPTSARANGVKAHNGVIELPLTKRYGFPSNRRHRKRQSSSTLATGDLADLGYTVDLSLGGDTTTLLFDTGSSDLWTINDQCQTDQCQAVRQTLGIYSGSNFTDSGLEFFISYGSSSNPTNSSGEVGFDTASIGGFTLGHQTIGSVNVTYNLNRPGWTGLLGAGFPASSENVQSIVRALAGANFTDPATGINSSSDPTAVLQAYGPPLSRLAYEGQLAAPLFTLTLGAQQPLADSGLASRLYIGGYPQGLTSTDFVWAPVVDTYVNSVFGQVPINWEVPIDGLFINGQQLPNPTNISNDGILSALIDSGGSVSTVPREIFNNVPISVLNFDQPEQPCASYTNLNFSVSINGTLFYVDPLDLIQPVSAPDATNPSGICRHQFIASDGDPYGASAYEYILGSPFMRNAIIAFYFGDQTGGGADPPKIGFKSIYDPVKVNEVLSSVFPSGTAGAPAVSFVSATESAASTTTDNSLPTISIGA